MVKVYKDNSGDLIKTEWIKAKPKYSGKVFYWIDSFTKDLIGIYPVTGKSLPLTALHSPPDILPKLERSSPLVVLSMEEWLKANQYTY